VVGGGGLASAPAGPGQVILGGLPITFAAAATPMQTALHHQRQPSKDRLDEEDSAAEQAQGRPLWFTVLGCRCAAADHWPSGRGRLLGGVGADAGSSCQAFDGRYHPWPGGQGDAYSGPPRRDCPRVWAGAVRRPRVPCCQPGPWATSPWVRAGQRRSSRSSLPPRKICPDRCGAATLNPAPAPTHQPCPSRRFLTRNRGRSVHEQRRSAAAPSGIASPSGCVTAPGAGDAFPPGPQSGPCCAGSPARGPMGCPGGAG
jgi:hypothetical protein